MLSDEEIREIRAELAHYDEKQAACIDAMMIVQRHRGWVSDEALQDLSEVLGMTTADLDGVATFYNLIYRKPVGRHIILLCDSISCWIMGFPRLKEHLVERLGIQYGQTTSDGRFTLLPIVCLGDCDHAPVLMIDRDLHRDLSPEKLDTILEGYP